MAQLSTNTAVILFFSGMFLIFGFIYETSYFATLGLSASSSLGARHFLYSGFLSTVIPFLCLIGLSLLVKFFSKRIEQNDVEALVKSANDFRFAQNLSMARFVFLMCAGIWLFSIFENRLFDMPHVWTGVPWLMLFTLQAFMLAIYTSPPQSRIAVLFAFFVAICLCISTWAIGSARFAQSSPSSTHIRNDGVVHITRTTNGFVAEAKPLKLPLPFLEKLADSLSGESNR